MISRTLLTIALLTALALSTAFTFTSSRSNSIVRTVNQSSSSSTTSPITAKRRRAEVDEPAEGGSPSLLPTTTNNNNKDNEQSGTGRHSSSSSSSPSDLQQQSERSPFMISLHTEDDAWAVGKRIRDFATNVCPNRPADPIFGSFSSPSSFVTDEQLASYGLTRVPPLCVVNQTLYLIHPSMLSLKQQQHEIRTGRSAYVFSPFPYAAYEEKEKAQEKQGGVLPIPAGHRLELHAEAFSILLFPLLSMFHINNDNIIPLLSAMQLLTSAAAREGGAKERDVLSSYRPDVYIFLGNGTPSSNVRSRAAQQSVLFGAYGLGQSASKTKARPSSEVVLGPASQGDVHCYCDTIVQTPTSFFQHSKPYIVQGNPYRRTAVDRIRNRTAQRFGLLPYGTQPLPPLAEIVQWTLSASSKQQEDGKKGTYLKETVTKRLQWTLGDAMNERKQRETVTGEGEDEGGRTNGSKEKANAEVAPNGETDVKNNNPKVDEEAVEDQKTTSQKINSTTTKPRMLILLRSARIIGEHEKLISIAKKMGFNVWVMYPDKESFETQLFAARYADILVGMHGNGLTLALLMDATEKTAHCRVLFELSHFGRKLRRLHNVYEVLASDARLWYHHEPAVNVALDPVVFPTRAERERERKNLLTKSFPQPLRGFAHQTAFYDWSRVKRNLQQAKERLQMCLAGEGRAYAPGDHVGQKYLK